MLPTWYMAAHVQDAEPPPPTVFRRLLGAGEPVTAQEIVEEIELGRLADKRGAIRALAGSKQQPRPYLVLNMISTLDGLATFEGRSGPLGGRADRELFHALRAGVDAVMVGAGTVRMERYRRLVRDERARRLRREQGLTEEPLACIVSGSLDLPADIPILGDPGARVIIVTSSAASLSPRKDSPDGEGTQIELDGNGGAQIEYIRAAKDGLLDLPAAMAQLHERFGVRTLLCEGGPHLNSQLLAAGLVDELFLSLSPKLAGGDPIAGALRIVSGPGFDEPIELGLVAVLEQGSHLFLRYRVIAAAGAE